MDLVLSKMDDISSWNEGPREIQKRIFPINGSSELALNFVAFFSSSFLISHFHPLVPALALILTFAFNVLMKHTDTTDRSRSLCGGGYCVTKCSRVACILGVEKR